MRRAILSGRLLDGTVADFMYKTPIFGRDDNSPSVIQQKLDRVSSANPFLPIVDGCGRLVGVKINLEKIALSLMPLFLLEDLKRLGQRTKNKPKPLLHAEESPCWSMFCQI